MHYESEIGKSIDVYLYGKTIRSNVYKHYWIIFGGKKYPMFNLDSDETKKYGLCWNLQDSTEYPDYKTKDRMKRCEKIIHHPTASFPLFLQWIDKVCPGKPTPEDFSRVLTVKDIFHLLENWNDCKLSYKSKGRYPYYHINIDGALFRMFPPGSKEWTRYGICWEELEEELEVDKLDYSVWTKYDTKTPLERCQEVSTKDIPFVTLLKKVNKLFPTTEEARRDPSVITAGQVLKKLNAGNEILYERGREGTPSGKIPYYWISYGGRKYPMYDTFGPKTAKYGLCWDTAY